MLDGDDAVFAAMRAGARGYLLKGADRRRDRRARSPRWPAARSSSAPASPAGCWRTSAAVAANGAQPFPELTEREREILDLVARGLTNPAIARRLVLSEKTVRNHVSNVFTKLQVTGRAEAVARARDAGLGTGPV